LKLIRLAPLEIQNKLFSKYAYFPRISTANKFLFGKQKLMPYDSAGGDVVQAVNKRWRSIN